MKCYIKDCREKADSRIQTKQFCQKHYSKYKQLLKSSLFKKNLKIIFKYFLEFPDDYFAFENQRIREYYNKHKKTKVDKKKKK